MYFEGRGLSSGTPTPNTYKHRTVDETTTDNRHRQQTTNNNSATYCVLYVSHAPANHCRFICVLFVALWFFWVTGSYLRPKSSLRPNMSGPHWSSFPLLLSLLDECRTEEELRSVCTRISPLLRDREQDREQLVAAFHRLKDNCNGYGNGSKGDGEGKGKATGGKGYEEG